MWEGPARWVSFTHVFLDCDGTLVRVEGIVELARLRGQEAMVAALTEAAMAGHLPLEAVYEQRLALIRPTRAEIRRLIQIYRENLIPRRPTGPSGPPCLWDRGPSPEQRTGGGGARAGISSGDPPATRPRGSRPL